MYRFFLNISWRNLTKRGTFPIINILSLSIGLAVVLLICLLVYNERSFDQQFKEHKNIYRINSLLTKIKVGETLCTTANAVGPAMQEAIPDVETTVRTYVHTHVVKAGDRPFKISHFCWADKDFFRLFDTPFIQGSAEGALSRPNTVAISERVAKRFFGNQNPVGEPLIIDNQKQLEVSAVYKDFPENSSFASYEMIGQFESSPIPWLSGYIIWGNVVFETFCLLADHADAAMVESQMIKVMDAAVKQESFFRPSLQRLDDIHLHSSNFRSTYTHAPSDVGKVNMLSLLATIILLVACVNYMNLSTARAQKRFKEIGVSKTLGAKRGGLIVRLYVETGLLTFVSFVIAFLLSLALLPVFNSLLGEQLNFSLIFHPAFLLGITLIWLITTLIAASYPAVYLSGFPPLLAIRQSSFSGRGKHAMVRKVLTVGQFAVAMILIVWVIVVQTQIRYVNSKDIGYNPHHLMGISLNAFPENTNFESLENEYKAQSSVVMISRSQGFPVRGEDNQVVLQKNTEDRNGSGLWSTAADSHLTELLELKFIAGKPLAEQAAGDSIVQIVLNRKAVEYLELTPEEAVGKRVMANLGWGDPVYVCGVVENFNVESLHRPITPVGFHNSMRMSKPFLIVRVKEGDISEQLKTYETVFKKYYPNELFEVSFPDVQIQNAYDAERRTSHVAVCFSILAILVACLGVFGLTAFMAEQRTKEIGVRKVLGASIPQIVNLFTGSYIKLLGVALLIAVPIAWWVGSRYLESFAYRISLGWWMFVAAIVIVVILTLLTVGFQAVKAAMVNPVKSIKTE